jgi:hypothetical protein
MNYKTNVQPAPRLHKLTKADIILDLVLSLNRGDSLPAEVRVEYAERQYNEMVKRGVIKEEILNA